MGIKAWPAALRAVGIDAREVNNFRNQKESGPCVNPASVFWHHDASPKGYSPGALSWITNAYNAGQPSAQIWVDYAGVWFFVGAGYASHAGVTKGPLTSSNSVGVETDHTSLEVMSPALHSSLRRGFAAICKVEHRGSDFVTFHKIEASPLGRKQDPYFTGTNPTDVSDYPKQLANERAAIQQIMEGSAVKPPIPVPEPPQPAKDDDMAYSVVKINGADAFYAVNTPVGTMEPIASLEEYTIGLSHGIYKPVREINQREFDVLAQISRELAIPKA